MKRRVSIVSEQSGMVAFVVTSFIIIMLSLVVLAFAQNVRREQRQALDRQLSSQAYYTAESAINETIKYLPSTATDQKEDCSFEPGQPTGQDTEAGGGNSNFKYTCVMWDKNPEELVFQNVDDQGKVVSLQLKSGDLRSVKIKWESPEQDNVNTGAACPGGNNFQSVPNYQCNLGIIRAEVMPFFTGGRDSLINKTFVGFLRPGGATAQTAFVGHADGNGALDQGNVYHVSCQQKSCEMTIGTSSNPLPAGKNFLAIKSIYKNSNVYISGTTYTGTQAEFSEAQIEIDATARASDVIKRIKVSVPFKADYNRSGYAVQAADGICKTLEVWPAGSSDPGNCNN